MVLNELAQYDIQRRLPPSPFGERFHALDREHGHTVSLTRLPAGLVAQPGFERRLTEVTARAAAVRHDGLQRVHGIIRQGNTSLLVAEPVAGRTLAGQRSNVLPVRVALSLGVQLATALAVLHRGQIVHGALNPAALFVTRSPVAHQSTVHHLQVMIADIGLPPLSAKELAAAPRLARELAPYRSPELAVKGQATPRSDIFSMGVILYELVSGQLPFNPQFLSRGLAAFYGQKVRPVDELRPGLPPAFTALIHRAIALRPPERFGSAGQLAQALDAVARELAIENGRDERTNGATQTVRRTDEQKPSTRSSPFAVAVEPVLLEITAGQQVVINVNIHNQGQDVDHATLQFEGLPRQWVSMSQEFVRLIPGTGASLPVTVAVPRDSSATAGRLSFQIKVTSTAHENFVTTVPGTLVIHPFWQIRTDVTPLQLEHGTRLTVTVRNEGNVTETFRVEGSNDDNSVHFKGEQEQLRLLAGATGTVTMRVSAVSQPAFGDPQVLPFSIRIWANSGVESEHNGELYVPPAIPRWLATVLAVLLLLATTAGAVTAIASFAGPDQEVVAMATATMPRATEANGTAAAITGSGGDEASVEAAPEAGEESSTAVEGDQVQAASGVSTATAIPSPTVAAVGNPEEGTTVEGSPASGEVVDEGTEPAEASESDQSLEGEGSSGQEVLPYIAYQIGNEAGGGQIRLVASDGSGDRLLVEDGAQPAWAPDGRRLAFVRSHYAGEGAARVYSGDVLHVVTVNGTLLAALTEGDGVQQIGGLSWSPDGQQIAFHALPVGSDSGRTQLFVANSDGSGVRQLTDGETDGGSSSSWPRWSPDGSHLLFYRQVQPGVGETEPDGALYLIGAAGGETRPLFADQALNIAPMSHSWSPDGSRILFGASDGQELRFYTIRADGSEPLPLPGVVADGSLARWSPDGTHILYLADGVDGQAALFSVSADGREFQQLTEGVAVAEATWSADGSRIVLVADREGDGLWELYQIGAQRAEDEEPLWEALPAPSGAITMPAWQPE